MNFGTVKFRALLVVLLGSAVCHAAPPAKKTAVSAPVHSKTRHHAGKKVRQPRGQKAIDSNRTRQIQESLIREHYMNGEPSGKWDDATQMALRRYQADQGWQSKSVPDSRALIRLGLGPDHGHLLNPESAMTTEPQLPHVARASSAVRRSTAPSVPVPAQNAAPVAAPALSPEN
jgi:hypothetical protein